MTASPHYFRVRQTPLFGWIHPAEGPSRDTGAILCPPLGHEHLCSHRAYRVLAEHLAAAGFTVLRFDYRGTGDSAGDDATESVSDWLDDIRSAIEEVRRIAGVRRIALAGLRVGGTLAAYEAAARGGVEALVLWAPCASGRAFAREMHLLGVRPDDPTSASSGDSIEAGGFVYSGNIVRGLRELDLSQLSSLPAQHVFLVRADHPGPTAAVQRRLRELGGNVTEQQAAGTLELTQSASFDAQVPMQIVHGICGWLASRFAILDHEPEPKSGDLIRLSSCDSGADLGTGVRETALRFGRKKVFAILAEPIANPNGVAVAILNTGVAYRIGLGRISVTLARRWARCGFRVLRMDLSGIGDSLGHTTKPDPYAGSALDDLREALALLQETSPRVVVMGTCSGAYLAIHCVLAGLPVAGVFAVNPQLYWRPGDPILAFIGGPRRLEEVGRLGRAMFSPHKWVRLVKRRSGIIPFLRHRLRSVISDRETVRRARETMANLIALSHSGSYGLLIFGAEDPGLAYLRSYLPPDFTDRLAPLALVEIPDADHTFSRRQDRDRLSEALTNHLTTTYS